MVKRGTTRISEKTVPVVMETVGRGGGERGDGVGEGKETGVAE